MSKLPEFNTTQEWGEFWETHSTVDYADEFESVGNAHIDRDAIRRSRVARELLDEALYRRLVKLAEKRHERPALVARRWLEERVIAEETWIVAREKSEPYSDSGSGSK